jgi:hypothetical protein
MHDVNNTHLVGIKTCACHAAQVLTSICLAYCKSLVTAEKVSLTSASAARLTEGPALLPEASRCCSSQMVMVVSDAASGGHERDKPQLQRSKVSQCLPTNRVLHLQQLSFGSHMEIVAAYVLCAVKTCAFFDVSEPPVCMPCARPTLAL